MATTEAGITFARGAQPYSYFNPTNGPQFIPGWGNVGSDRQFYWTGPLPDFSLAPGSRVQLVIYRQGNAGNGFSLQDVAVTLSRETEASIVQLPDVGPFMLVPGPGA